MTARNTFTSLTDTITQTLENFLSTAKDYLAIEPTPLWQKAMEEPRYHAYRQFKSDLAYQSEIALQTIVSPYAVIASHHTTISEKENINHLLRANSESAVSYFYDDVINHLVELSFDNSNAEDFKSMLAFYKNYVPDDIYQAVLTRSEAIDKTNTHFQSNIIDVTKQINQTFKRFQSDRNARRSAEQKQEQAHEPENVAQTHHAQHQRPNFNQLIMMGAISLLVNKNHLGLGLGLATTALFAEPVNAALPTVANPIATQYVQPGQAFSHDIDLNHVFNDADGDIMTFGGVTLADGSPLPSWLNAAPIKLSGRDYANDAQDVDVVGEIAYVANGQYGLLILNISNPANKVFLGSYNTPGHAFGIAAQNGVAYVADNTFGLQIIDVSNSRNPTLLGNYNTPGSARDVTVQNGVAYVADYDFGLQLINVTNASDPTLLSNVDTYGWAYSVTVQNRVAYVADWISGLQLINVTNVSNPMWLGSQGAPGNATSVTIQNGVAYLTNTAGLQLINVSNTRNLTLLGRYNTAGWAYDVAVQAGVAYVADDYSGLQLIDVSNISSPRLLGSLDTPGRAFGVALQNGVVYVADGGSGLQLINVSNANNLMLLGSVGATEELARDVTVQGNIAYVADRALGLQLINVSNASNPMSLGRVATPGDSYRVTVLNDVAYVADYSSLQLINVSNVGNPTLLASYNTPGSARDVTMQNGVAYVADWASGLQLINVSNVNNLTLLGSYNTSGNAQGITVQNGVAYVADGGLQLINVSNASSPTLLGNYNTPGSAQGVAVQNGVAYVADYDFGLQLINVSNVGNPTLLASYNTPGNVRDVTVQNGVAYIVDSLSDLLFINVSNVYSPTLLGNYNTPGSAGGVTVQNGVAYVADYGSGLQILSLSHVRLIAIAPSNAIGNYSFSVHATNINGEWISATFELRVGLPSSAVPTPAMGFSSVMGTGNSEPRLTFSQGSSSSSLSNTVASSVKTSGAIIFTIIVSPEPVPIEPGVSTQLTTAYLSITGNANPSDVVYTVQGNNPNVAFTVNGVEVAQFTQADVDSGFVEVMSFETGCPSSTEVQLQASVAGSAQEVDVSLIFQLASTSCNNGASRLADTAILNTALLLTTAGLGFWAKERDKKQRDEFTEIQRYTTAIQLKN